MSVLKSIRVEIDALCVNEMFKTYRTNGASPVHAGYWNSLMPPFVRGSVKKEHIGKQRAAHAV
jgi:hypothetical protein